LEGTNSKKGKIIQLKGGERKEFSKKKGERFQKKQVNISLQKERKKPLIRYEDKSLGGREKAE